MPACRFPVVAKAPLSKAPALNENRVRLSGYNPNKSDLRCACMPTAQLRNLMTKTTRELTSVGSSGFGMHRPEFRDNGHLHPPLLQLAITESVYRSRSCVVACEILATWMKADIRMWMNDRTS